MLVEGVPELPVLAVNLVLNTVVVKSLDRSGKVNHANQCCSKRGLGYGDRHSGESDDANIDHGGFAGLVQCPGVNQCVGFIGVDPIIVHRDVKIPIFDGSVRSKPVGQFGAFTVIVELFEFDLNLDVIVLTHIRFAFNRERVACQMKGLVDGSGHGDILT